jgi:hypothetical protein
MKNSLLILLMAGIIGSTGCSLTGGTTRQERTTRATQQASDLLDELRSDRALNHVIQGSVYDVTGDYASAILEYQEALQDEPTAAIY